MCKLIIAVVSMFLLTAAGEAQSCGLLDADFCMQRSKSPNQSKSETEARNYYYRKGIADAYTASTEPTAEPCRRISNPLCGTPGYSADDAVIDYHTSSLEWWWEMLARRISERERNFRPTDRGGTKTREGRATR